MEPKFADEDLSVKHINYNCKCLDTNIQIPLGLQQERYSILSP